MLRLIPNKNLVFDFHAFFDEVRQLDENNDLYNIATINWQKYIIWNYKGDNLHCIKDFLEYTSYVTAKFADKTTVVVMNLISYILTMNTL